MLSCERCRELIKSPADVSISLLKPPPTLILVKTLLHCVNVLDENKKLFPKHFPGLLFLFGNKKFDFALEHEIIKKFI